MAVFSCMRCGYMYEFLVSNNYSRKLLVRLDHCAKCDELTTFRFVALSGMVGRLPQKPAGVPRPSNATLYWRKRNFGKAATAPLDDVCKAMPLCAARPAVVVALLVTLVLLFILSALRETRAPAACDALSPIVYDAVMDAGSTGTRIYVYAFERRIARGSTHDADDNADNKDSVDTSNRPVGGQQVQLMLRSEYVKRVQPGLSSFRHNHHGAAVSLAGLLRSAVRTLPTRHRRCTAVGLKATAGLRLLPHAEQTALLREAAAALQRTPLRSHGASIITGSEEAVYGWLSINYLLGRLYDERSRRTVTIDMGGGSAQIVFATSDDAGTWLPFQYVTQLRLGKQRRMTLYRHSYLGLGLNEARRSLLRSFVQPHIVTSTTTTTTTMVNAAEAGVDANANTTTTTAEQQQQQAAVIEVSFPCVPRGSAYGDTDAIAQLVREAAGGAATPRATVQVVLRNDDDAAADGARTFDACVAAFAQRVLHSNATCAFRACGHDAVPQPSLTAATQPRDVYVFSYFYDLIRAVYPHADAPVYIRTFRDAGTTLCGDVHAAASFGDLNAHTACVDFAYLYAFLRNGLGLADTSVLHVQNNIDGKAVSWSLGASLASLLDLDV